MECLLSSERSKRIKQYSYGERLSLRIKEVACQNCVHAWVCTCVRSSFQGYAQTSWKFTNHGARSQTTSVRHNGLSRIWQRANKRSQSSYLRKNSPSSVGQTTLRTTDIFQKVNHFIKRMKNSPFVLWGIPEQRRVFLKTQVFGAGAELVQRWMGPGKDKEGIRITKAEWSLLEWRAQFRDKWDQQATVFSE